MFTADEAADRERRELETLAAGLKARRAPGTRPTTIQACREACGGAGYLRANRFAALKADTDVFTTFEGDNTVLLQLAAKNLLTDYQGRSSASSTRSALARSSPARCSRRSPSAALRELARRRCSRPRRRGDLLDRETQLDLFRWRQEHMLAGAARRLKRGIDAGRDPFDVLIDCQDHVVAAARAWVDLVVLEAFADAVERCEDTTIRRSSTASAACTR